MKLKLSATCEICGQVTDYVDSVSNNNSPKQPNRLLMALAHNRISYGNHNRLLACPLMECIPMPLITFQKFLKQLGIDPEATNPDGKPIGIVAVWDRLIVDPCNTRHADGWEYDREDGRKDLARLIPEMMLGYRPVKVGKEPKEIVLRTHKADDKSDIFGILCGRRRLSVFRWASLVASGQRAPDETMTIEKATKILKLLIPSPEVAATDKSEAIPASQGWMLDVMGVIPDFEARIIAVDTFQDTASVAFSAPQLLAQRLKIWLDAPGREVEIKGKKVNTWSHICETTNGGAHRLLPNEQGFSYACPRWLVEEVAAIAATGQRVTNSDLRAFTEHYHKFREMLDPSGYKRRNPWDYPVEGPNADPRIHDFDAAARSGDGENVDAATGSKVKGLDKIKSDLKNGRTRSEKSKIEPKDLKNYASGLRNAGFDPVKNVIANFLTVMSGNQLAGGLFQSEEAYTIGINDALARLVRCIDKDQAALEAPATVTKTTPTLPSVNPAE